LIYWPLAESLAGTHEPVSSADLGWVAKSLECVIFNFVF